MTVEVVRLGDSGLKVSQITLGCMSFGGGSGRHSWAIGEDESRVIIKQALDAGITTFDTANVYSTGRSEEITGKILGELADRDDIVVATKVHGEMRPGPYGHGQSRKAILAEIDNSLRRLDMEYVDLYQIHRYDAEVPMEETMEALHDVVKAGKARYIGASSMWTWQFQALQNVAETNGWTPFVSMQNHYNLLYREEEREMMPYCAATGVGVIPWSPLAGGRLVRDWGVRGTARSELNERESSPNDPGDKIDRRDGRQDRQRARRAARGHRTRLDADQAVRALADHRRHQARAAHRGTHQRGHHPRRSRDRGVRGRLHPTRDPGPSVALTAPPSSRLQTSSAGDDCQ